LLRLLARHRPFDADEAIARRKAMAFVMAHADCFRRELAEGHMTGSAWIVDPERSRVLLVRHRKLDLWLQPGGHADSDPDLARVAAREAREETGLVGLRPVGAGIFDVDVHEIPARPGAPAHLHYDVRFLMEASPAAQLAANEESLAIRWWPLREIANGGEASLARMAKKTLGTVMPSSVPIDDADDAMRMSGFMDAKAPMTRRGRRAP
jgi:ADP-ribose pyrophosphatase YjhB (NUDIX family)